MNDILATEGFRKLYSDYLKSQSEERATSQVVINKEEDAYWRIFLPVLTAVLFVIVGNVLSLSRISTSDFAWNIFWPTFWVVFPSICVWCWMTPSNKGPYVFFMKRHKGKRTKKVSDPKKQVITSDFLKFIERTGNNEYEEILTSTKQLISKMNGAKISIDHLLAQNPTEELKKVALQIVEDISKKLMVLEQQQHIAEVGLSEFKELCVAINAEFRQQQSVEELAGALNLTNAADEFILMNQNRLERLAGGTLRAQEALQAFSELKKEQSLESFELFEMAR